MEGSARQRKRGDSAAANEYEGEQQPSSSVEGTSCQAGATCMSSNHLYLLTSHAFWVVALLPHMLWLVAVLGGMLHFRGVERVVHLMTWYDRLIFRTGGPLLPMVVLALRSAVFLILPAGCSSSLGASPQASSTRSPAEQQHGEGGPAGDAAHSGRCRGHATLRGTCALVYTAVILLRLIVYGAHVQYQGKGAKNGGAAALVSDHVFLAASVLACLEMELVCGLADLMRLLRADALMEAGVKRTLSLVAMVSILVAAWTLFVFTCADMYFTRRHFHHPTESAWAVATGLSLFQAPVLLLLHKEYLGGRRLHGCTMPG